MHTRWITVSLMVLGLLGCQAEPARVRVPEAPPLPSGLYRVTIERTEWVQGVQQSPLPEVSCEAQGAQGRRVSPWVETHRVGWPDHPDDPIPSEAPLDPPWRFSDGWKILTRPRSIHYLVTLDVQTVRSITCWVGPRRAWTWWVKAMPEGEDRQVRQQTQRTGYGARSWRVSVEQEHGESGGAMGWEAPIEKK